MIASRFHPSARPVASPDPAPQLAARRWSLPPLAGSALALLALAAPPATAQDVQEQLDELKQLNEELRSRVDELEATADESLLEEPELTDEELSRIPGIGFSYGDVRGQLKIFGDVGFKYNDPAPRGEGDNYFGVGVLDFFLTAEVGDHFQVLSETKIEGHDAATNFSQERLWAAYRVNEAFYVKAGMEHSAISRWNRLYHHGSWLELTIARPFIAQYEGDGGIMPLHNIGLELGGQHDTGVGRVDYYGALVNGRAALPSEKTIAFDGNDQKAVEIYGGFIPAPVPNLHFGAVARIDEVPPESGTPSSSVDSFIVTGFAQYWSGPFTLLSEYGYIRDEDETTGQSYDSTTGYAQFGYRVGDFTPYIRADFKDMAQGDTFYARQDRDLSAWRNTIGVRYDFNAHAAVKLEFDFGKQDQRNAAGNVSSVDVKTVALQLSWAI